LLGGWTLFRDASSDEKLMKEMRRKLEELLKKKAVEK